MKQADDFYLSFPNDLKAIVTQKLTMFKMMSAVDIIDMSDELIQLGVVDEGFDNAFKLNNQQSVALVKTLDDIELDDASEWEAA
jgi:folate-binding Fe-S cluster repair protein YgfZ